MRVEREKRTMHNNPLRALRPGNDRSDRGALDSRADLGRRGGSLSGPYSWLPPVEYGPIFVDRR